jgi:hypothetical protein
MLPPYTDRVEAARRARPAVVRRLQLLGKQFAALPRGETRRGGLQPPLHCH